MCVFQLYLYCKGISFSAVAFSAGFISAVLISAILWFWKFVKKLLNFCRKCTILRAVGQGQFISTLIDLVS